MKYLNMSACEVLYFAVICVTILASKEFQKIVSMILKPVDGF